MHLVSTCRLRGFLCVRTVCDAIAMDDGASLMISSAIIENVSSSFRSCIFSGSALKSGTVFFPDRRRTRVVFT
jgi:hypothetical protein